LTTTQDRLAMIRAHGVDDVVAIGFTPEVAALDATEFVRQVVDAFQPVEIVVGSDFAFGHKRTGNPELLASLGEQYGYGVRIIRRIGEGNQDFSSRRVRTS